jgi:hypothetical protein
VSGDATVFQHKNVKGVVTFEGGYVFPPDAMPPSLLKCAGATIVQGSATTAENFAKLTKIPFSSCMATINRRGLDKDKNHHGPHN